MTMSWQRSRWGLLATLCRDLRKTAHTQNNWFRTACIPSIITVPCSGPPVCQVADQGGSEQPVLHFEDPETPSAHKGVLNDPVYYRNGTPLLTQIHTDVFDGIEDDEINLEDMDYWFSDKEGDIVDESLIEYLEPLPHKDFTVVNETWGNVRAL